MPGTRHMNALNLWLSIKSAIDEGRGSADSLLKLQNIQRELRQDGLVIVEHLRGGSLVHESNSLMAQMAQTNGYIGRQPVSISDLRGALAMMRQALVNVQKAKAEPRVVNAVVALKTFADALSAEAQATGNQDCSDFNALLASLHALDLDRERGMAHELASGRHP